MTPRHAERLAVWKRYSVRLGLTYGAAVLLVLTALAAALYQLTSDAALNGVRAHLRGVAIALAAGLDGDDVAGLGDPEDHGRPGHAALEARLAGILEAEPEIESVYVLRPTDEPGWLRFAADVVRHGAPGASGQRYDATKAPNMLAGLERPTVEQQAYTDEWGTFLSGYAPLLGDDGETLALVGVDMRVTEVARIRSRLLRVTMTVYGLALVGLGLVGLGVARDLRGPLERLLAATEAVDAGDLSVRTELAREDEFGLLGHHFDHMAEGLAERELIRDTFGRYVSREVARAILSGPDAARLGGDLREVTVLFSDVRGYSTLSERLPPERVVSLMNEYFGAMSEVIEAHGGTVIEFLGDGILAVFGAPGRLGDHAARAVRAAVEMRERLVALNGTWEDEGVAEQWRALGLGRLGARIGVHTGQVVAGNLGSPRRMKYAVIGDAVNLASRVEGLNNALGTDVLFTAATRAQLPEELAARAEDQGEHAVKGRAAAVRVYTLP